MIFDNEQDKSVALECKKYEKYLGILTDNNLSWKHHIDHTGVKMFPDCLPVSCDRQNIFSPVSSNIQLEQYYFFILIFTF